MRWLDVISDSMDMSQKWWEMVKDREAWGATAHGLQTLRQDLATEKQTIEETTYLNYLNYK